MGEVIKPCEMPCEKCGHDDVYRLFRQSGATWHTEEYGQPRNRYASATSHIATSFRDHIAHTCRCCGCTWQTLPMRKPKRTKPLPTDGSEG